MLNVALKLVVHSTQTPVGYMFCDLVSIRNLLEGHFLFAHRYDKITQILNRCSGKTKCTCPCGSPQDCILLGGCVLDPQILHSQ